MGIFGLWFLGKSETVLKEMRAQRVAKLAVETDLTKTAKLKDEIDSIDAELKKYECK